MTGSVFLRLVAKDLYLLRGFVIGALAAGALSLGIALTGRVGFAVGGILLISTIVATGVFIAMLSVLQERKDRSILFSLSLPISPQRYAQAKVVAVLLAYLVPWGVLTAGAMLYVALPPIADGLAPWALLILVYFLMLQCLLVAVLFCTSSDGWAGVTIVGLNLSITFFMTYLGSMSSIGGSSLSVDEAVWNAEFFRILGVELAGIVLAFVIIAIAQARRREYV